MLNVLEGVKFIVSIVWVILWYDLKTDGDFDLPHLFITGQFRQIGDFVRKLALGLKEKTK